MKTCPECQSDIPDEAAVCRHCGRRVVGKICPDCCSRCSDEAKKCNCCGYGFDSKANQIDVEPFAVIAKLLPTFLMRQRLLCQRLDVDQDKITISTPGYFSLYTHGEEIPWQKVAGFDYRKGIFWDAISIETRGQKASNMTCLAKADGHRIRDVLRKLKQ
jgi:hypothetical protein